MRVLFIPGNGNSDINDNWILWTKKEVEKLGIKAIAENMPDPDFAREKYWIPFIEKKLENDPDSILVGHSSGALAIQRYIETHKVLCAILVGTSHTDLNDEHERASGYFSRPWQWEKMRENAKWIALFASTDDPYIPISEARFIHEKLQCEYHEFTDQGHMGSDIGKMEFPEIVEVIRRRGIRHK